jgi:hypothetical protein
VWQFISYAFLHGGLMHIAGNMYFLWLFGNNVNDRMGTVGYLCFYLAGAVFSGVGHTLGSSSPVLGASGAVAAVTGAYLVLFPQTLLTVVYWFFIIGVMELPALYFIALKLIVIDNIIVRYEPHAVAYNAHLAGYAFGIAALMLLLGFRLMEGSHFDLWGMLRRWNQRRRYRDLVSGGYDPFSGRSGAKAVRSREVKQHGKLEAEQEEKVKELRMGISQRMQEQNVSAAAELYLQLLDVDSGQVPPRRFLLDIANQLASENRHEEAAEAYEKFLRHFGNYEYANQVELMVGLIYSRYLNKPVKAVKHLKAAEEKLSDAGQRQMCRSELEKLEG